MIAITTISSIRVKPRYLDVRLAFQQGRRDLGGLRKRHFDRVEQNAERGVGWASVRVCIRTGAASVAIIAPGGGQGFGAESS
jgi:hypothetical protein